MRTETGIEFREFYIGNYQTEYRAMQGNTILDCDTNKVALIRRIAKRFGENPRSAATKQTKSGA